MRISKFKISMLMAEKNLNQKKLAEIAEMSRSNLSVIINGKSCQPKTIFRIAQSLNVDVTEIIDLEEH